MLWNKEIQKRKQFAWRHVLFGEYNCKMQGARGYWRSQIAKRARRHDWRTTAFFKRVIVSLQYSKTTFLKRKLYLYSLYFSPNILMLSEPRRVPVICIRFLDCARFAIRLWCYDQEKRKSNVKHTTVKGRFETRSIAMNITSLALCLHPHCSCTKGCHKVFQGPKNKHFLGEHAPIPP